MYKIEQFKKFNEQLFKDVHLSVIRELGRQVGVKSPTSKKKEQLVKELIAIQNGTLAPVEPSKRGAPPKIKIDITSFLKENYEENVEYSNIPPVNKVQVNDSAEKCAETFVMEGVLEQNNVGYGFLRANF